MPPLTVWFTRFCYYHDDRQEYEISLLKRLIIYVHFCLWSSHFRRHSQKWSFNFRLSRLQPAQYVDRASFLSATDIYFNPEKHWFEVPWDFRRMVSSSWGANTTFQIVTMVANFTEISYDDPFGSRLSTDYFLSLQIILIFKKVQALIIFEGMRVTKTVFFSFFSLSRVAKICAQSP